MKGYISIIGARENNLKNIDVAIPWHEITVLTGLSGSGKSSLAMDTLYAEGLRRYVECLSTYARQFFERIDRPDMDDIAGLPPVVSIESVNNVKNARSTVGTTTEIYDYLRLLYAKVGRTYCPSCGQEVRPNSAQSVAEALLSEYRGRRAVVTIPLPPEKLDAAHLLAAGVTRIMRDEGTVDIDPDTPLRHGDEAVVDRIVLKDRYHSRLVDSLETAFAESSTVFVYVADHGRMAFSSEFACPRCPGVRFLSPSPLLFSFNSPHGACPRCNGFGNVLDIDPDLIVPDPRKSLEDGAVEPFTKPSLRDEMARLLHFAESRGIDTGKPFSELSPEEKRLLFEGDDAYGGIRGVFDYLESKRHKVGVRVFLSRYRSGFDCPSCKGTRLRKEASYVRVGGKTISELTALSIGALHRFFEDLELDEHQLRIADEIVRQIRSRVEFLLKVGLDYLTLARLTRTLSGGEAQRVNLACQLGASLTETLYIMDEPSIGLHPRDIERLTAILKDLRDRDNTVIVVEHDLDMIRASDYVVELGPGSGEMGGQVVYQGPLAEFLDGATESLTRSYLKGDRRIELPRRRRSAVGVLRVVGAAENNLKGIDVEIPLGTLTCVTGVSGSGKSTLVVDVLYAALARRMKGITEKAGRHEALEGAEHLTDVMLLDQTPIGRTSRSNPITYVKGWDEVRKLFAATPEARAKGLNPSSFSFNVPGGRCETCEGEGVEKVEMFFLADVKVRCETCDGKRFKPEVLQVRYRGRNVDEVLAMTVAEALEFFDGPTSLHKKLQVLCEVGLGYLRLGQPAPTLSGGEAQRLKIAKELARKGGRGVLYILDEPTVGLHAEDVRTLLAVLNRLVDAGNTVLVIEHNLEVIKCCDWVIDLGPEGGEEGGRVVAAGTPEQVAQVPASHTGRFLKPLLNGAQQLNKRCF